MYETKNKKNEKHTEWEERKYYLLKETWPTGVIVILCIYNKMKGKKSEQNERKYVKL